MGEASQWHDLGISDHIPSWGGNSGGWSKVRFRGVVQTMSPFTMSSSIVIKSMLTIPPSILFISTTRTIP
jgi:hypothetical protein